MRMPLLRCAALVVLSVVVTACGDGERTQAFDRERERRAVMRVVLMTVFTSAEHEGAREIKRFVLDPELVEGPRLPSERTMARMEADGRRRPASVKLSNGHHVRAPSIEGLDARLVADWAAHAAASPTPTDLDLPLPIDWFKGADWDALKGVVVTGGFDSPKWQAFHVRHPDSAGWISLSNVGFSPKGDQALIYTSSAQGSLSGAGLWYMLEKRGDDWSIIQKKVVWVS